MAGGAGGYGNDDDSGRMIVDINVTPLVDITLVLLIIFMVTASLIVNPAHQGRPAQGGVGHRDRPRRTLALTLNKEGVLFLNGERSSDEARRPLHRQRAAQEPASCRRSSPPTRWCPTATSSTSSTW